MRVLVWCKIQGHRCASGCIVPCRHQDLCPSWLLGGVTHVVDEVDGVREVLDEVAHDGRVAAEDGVVQRREAEGVTQAAVSPSPRRTAQLTESGGVDGGQHGRRGCLQRRVVEGA